MFPKIRSCGLAVEPVLWSDEKLGKKDVLVVGGCAICCVCSSVIRLPGRLEVFLEDE